jgi:uncharacterized protein (TIGR02284 family)
MDGERGYRTAAQHVRNPHLRTVFEEYAQQRSGFVRELRGEVERLSGPEAVSGPLKPAAYRGWINVKSALSDSDGHAIIAACEAGEEAASAAYESALETDLLGDSQGLVTHQLRKIQDALQHLRNLKQGSGTNAESPKTQTGGGGV